MTYLHNGQKWKVTATLSYLIASGRGVPYFGGSFLGQILTQIDWSQGFFPKIGLKLGKGNSFFIFLKKKQKYKCC